MSATRADTIALTPLTRGVARTRHGVRQVISGWIRVAVLEKGRISIRQPVIIIIPVALVIRVGFVQPLVNVHHVVLLTLQQVIILAGHERPHHVAHGEEAKQARQHLQDARNRMGRDDGGHVAKGVAADTGIPNTREQAHTHGIAEGQEREQETNACGLTQQPREAGRCDAVIGHAGAFVGGRLGVGTRGQRHGRDGGRPRGGALRWDTARGAGHVKHERGAQPGRGKMRDTPNPVSANLPPLGRARTVRATDDDISRAVGPQSWRRNRGRSRMQKSYLCFYNK